MGSTDLSFDIALERTTNEIRAHSLYQRKQSSDHSCSVENEIFELTGWVYSEGYHDIAVLPNPPSQ